MEAFLIVVAPFILGSLLIWNASDLARVFCGMGKRIWKIGTFGKTDMAVFYQEKGARSAFKGFGVILIAWSVMMVGFGIHAVFFA